MLPVIFSHGRGGVASGPAGGCEVGAMKTYISIIAFSVLSFGCAIQGQKTVSSAMTSGIPFEKKTSEYLQQQPIPFPQMTPFDSDAKKREVYLTAFSKAWNFVASGSALHGTIGVSIPNGFEESWNAGWKDGYKIASDHWMRELEKLREENTRKNPSQ